MFLIEYAPIIGPPQSWPTNVIFFKSKNSIKLDRFSTCVLSVYSLS